MFLLIANVSAGALNYLFQVRAAAQLDAATYGSLNGWMAYLSLALFVGGAAQIATNFLPWSEAGVRRVGFMTVAVPAIALAWFASVRARSATPSAFELGVAATLLGTVQQWTLGQFQARTWFVWMGSAVVLSAVMRWTATFLPLFSTIEVEQAYFWALPMSYAIACLFQGLVMLTLRAEAEPARARSMTQRSAWMGALTLACAMSLLPQLDMLNLRGLQSDYELGLFARTALFGKAVFFGALTLLQIALPHHVRAHQGIIHPEYHRIQWLERLGIAACILGSAVFAVTSPWVTSRFLGFELSSEQQLWVLLSCLTLTALYGHLQAVQVACATGGWRRAAFRLLAVAALYPIAQALGRQVSITFYLGAALTYYSALEIIGRLYAAANKRDVHVAPSAID
jgi:hypothetical protein